MNSHFDSERKVVIRHGRADDYDQWLELWTGYNAFYGRIGETALPQETTHLTWDRLLDPNEPMFLLVASEGGRLVGFTHLVLHRTTIARELTCYLQDLFIAPDARRRGIAEQLIGAAKSEASERSCAKLYWQTHQSNAAARGLYDGLAEHRGFIVYDVRF